MLSFLYKTTNVIQCHKMLTQGHHVLIGLSGGPDSVALLLMLIALQPRFDLTLGVAHINHCLRGDESDRDEAFARTLAETHHLPFYLARIDVPARAKAEKRSFEDAARLARYEFYTQLCQNHGYHRIALGHNSSDNAEQVLMNLLRGSGIKGLTGIPPVRPLVTESISGIKDEILIIRPLIETSRQEILEWLLENNQDFVQDSSNADNRYLRNKIRNELIPHLEAEYNPSIIPSLNRLSHILMDEEAWMEDETQRIFEANATWNANDVLLPKTLLMSSPPALARRLTREAILMVKGDLKRIRLDHIEAIRNLAATKTDGSVLDLPGRIRIIKGIDVICFHKASSSLRTLGKVVPNHLKK